MTGITYQSGLRDRGWLNALPMIAFTVGIIFTGLVVNSAWQSLQSSRIAEFDRKAADLVEDVDNLLADQRYLMLGLRSLFDGSPDVGRLDFKRYLDSIDMSNSFPSAYGMGWFLRVPHHMLAEFEAIVREDRSIEAEGYPDFKVFPQTDAAEHHVITYIYPWSQDKTVFGFDVGSNHERLLTLEQARDSGTFSATAPLKLLDGNRNEQGVLLMLPVYSMERPKNLQQRRQSYIGTLSGVFKINVLMAGSTQNEFTSVGIRDITDSRVEGKLPEASESASGFFYQTGAPSDTATTLVKSTSIAGREWEFELGMSPAALAALKDNTLCWIIAALGSFFSILAALAAVNLTSARDRAVRQADSLSAELLKANEDLQQSNSDLSQFAYIASHDLEIPVRNVDMSVTLLEDALTTPMDPQVRKYLNDLRDSAGRMGRLVEDLQEFAQVERETLQLEETDLHETVAAAERKLLQFIEESGATFTIADLPVVRGDQVQLERLMVNLISNAIKHRHEARAPQIDIDACLVGSDWEVRIADNGIGIDKRFYKKVFEPFQRLNSHDDREGAGLGLSICRQIVGCHDGDLYIESSSDAGTTFVIRLPVQAEMFKQAA